MQSSSWKWLGAILVAGACASHGAESERPSNRTDSVEAICQRLEIGPGAVIADVGCGDGPDTMIFASIVGSNGTVLAQEIDVNQLKRVAERTDKRGFHQVVPVLGQSSDPHLPDGFSDLVYLNRVFHHLARPREMLDRLWLDLKPGGLLVIVDQQKGPLRDWTPTEKRESEHHWTGETTVVRLAREAGFVFHDALDDLWHESQPFVLAFRRPLKSVQPAGDPEPALPLDVRSLLEALPRPAAEAAEAILVVALDQGRTVLRPLRERWPASTRVFDVVLEEWALSREELPPGAPLPGVEGLRTDQGRVDLPADLRIGVVLFVDAYHRLWEPALLLEQLKPQLSPSGRIAVIDRQGPDAEPRRLANHRRRISSQHVTEDMGHAGLRLRQTVRAPAKDRFFLLFETQP